ncbi:unnamed protein product [Caenorhabditis sp. 36 PRJEB53466]|nr:unnamed protein product [Caenorhabditis sp. 36 PRJEB53466]
MLDRQIRCADPTKSPLLFAALADMKGESAANTSRESVEVGPPSPRPLATPRIATFNLESPLSTKREKSKMTPRFRRPAPKVIKTAPPMRSVYSVTRDPMPRLVSTDGSTEPLHSPIYDISKRLSFFEQTFQINEIIGKGSFGEVFSARSLEDSRMYAVKVSISLVRHNCSNKYREVKNHMLLPSHYNLVEFKRAWEEAGRLYIQTELCEMSLLTFCTHLHQLPEATLWNVLIDLLNAVHHLHSNDMIHDDIKPENVLLTREGICKLGDFGLVIDLKNPNDVKTAEEGDSKYLAQEVLNGQPSKASDIFSLGVTLLEAATDLDIPSNGDAWHQIRTGKIPERFFEGISSDMKFLITWMLDANPARRPTTTQLLHFPSVKRRLLRRMVFVKYVHIIHNFRSVFYAVITWFLAFLSVVFHPPIAMLSAVRSRRSAMLSELAGQQPTQQNQHTPIQSPEGSKVFSESLTGHLVRSSTPFDHSDDENTAHRRLFPNPLPVSRFNLDDDDEDEDDAEPATSSSNSSAIESNASPSRPLRDRASWMRQGTPKSARKIILPPFGARPTTPAVPDGLPAQQDHGGSGDTFTNADRAAWMRNKYERMMRMEARLDSDDNDADEVNEEPLQHAIPPPLSCPPSMLMRNLRRVMRPAPSLNFKMLDDPTEQPLKPETKKEGEKEPTAETSKRIQPMRVTRSRARSLRNSASGD